MPPDALLGAVVLRNFRLVGQLGRGAHGEVFEAAILDAADPAEGALPRRAAVKLFSASVSPARVAREAAALGLCRLPGVVPLLAHGVHQGRAVLVTERVWGSRFPGALPAEAAQDALRARVGRLLRAVAGVHDQGVLHRDLKPDNVMVTPAGEVTLLDFSLARGLRLGDTVTRDGAVLGTLRYAAPEQLRGERLGPEADLWAVGAMAFEAITGLVPHALTPDGRLDLDGMVARRASGEPAPSLRGCAEGWPEGALRVLDALLRSDPSRRLASAHEALRRGGWTDETSLPELPWLGDDELVRAAAHAAAGGRCVRVSGARGSGRTRLLEEVEARLTACERRPERLLPASTPLGSLALALGEPGRVGQRQAERWLVGRLQERAREGVVWLVDDSDGVDARSQRLLARAPQVASVIALPPGRRGDLRLSPLPEEALRPLFRGPQEVWHVPEDAARELHARTGGSPARVAAEQCQQSGLTEMMRQPRARGGRAPALAHARLREAQRGRRPRRLSRRDRSARPSRPARLGPPRAVGWARHAAYGPVDPMEGVDGSLGGRHAD